MQSNRANVQFCQELNTSEAAVRENVETNLQRVLPQFRIGHAVLCGGGPSLEDHIEDIRAKQAAGCHVFAMNGSANYLKKHGIIANYHVLMDARPENIDFVRTPDPLTHFLVASQCHPSIFDALKGHPVTMWHAMASDDLNQLFTDCQVPCMIPGGSTVGLRTMNLAYSMGYFVIDLYGYDSSARGDQKHAYDQPLNHGQPVYEFSTKVGGREYIASGPMASQADQFPDVAQKLAALGIKIRVHGDGLLPARWQEHLDIINGPAEVREAAKYSRMWEQDIYRKYSPGAELVDEAKRYFVGDGKVIDFGCGTGRALNRFRELGYDILGVDITPNCLDGNIFAPLCISPLWALPENVKGDFGYCTDVMEHIPPEYVQTVVENIMNAVDRAFFQIALVDDVCGQLIGQKLHLTVQPYQWWHNLFERLGFEVEGRDEGNTAIFIVTRHRYYLNKR